MNNMTYCDDCEFLNDCDKSIARTPSAYCCDEKKITNNKNAAKYDSGKPKLTLVPTQIIYDIARVREYGIKKYGDPDNWKKIEVERYRDAAYRHFLAYINNPEGFDEESHLPHLAHLACNIAFLCEMQKYGYEPIDLSAKEVKDGS